MEIIGMFGNYWIAVKDTYPPLIDLYRRHYSSLKKPAWVYRQFGISGNGESLSLCTASGTAGFCWTKQKKRDDGQKGVNCSFFRNEGSLLSSELILEAEFMALNKWPDTVRFFTYIDPLKIRHKRDPGRCFVRAGWKKCGRSKSGKLIFEKSLVSALAQEIGVWR
jgi:hypothetical protein